MANRRTRYWLLTGAVIGFGVIAILSIGLPFLVLGLAMVAFGIVRMGIRGLWAVVVGVGVLPAAILLWDVSSGPWACEPQSGVVNIVSTSAGGGSYYPCVQTPIGTLTTYHVMAFWFGVIALLGLAWPLVGLLIQRARGRMA
jgi:hypothetical protein